MLSSTVAIQPLSVLALVVLEKEEDFVFRILFTGCRKMI